MLELGIKGHCEHVVKATETAKGLCSGLLEVLATPALIAFSEYTALKSVDPLLDEGLSTVGTLINISHVSPTPVGCNVICETELIEIDGRRLVFSVKVTDEFGLIGEGIQERCIVDNEKFMSKLAKKVPQQK